MRKYVPTDRFAAICAREQRAGTRIRLDLIDDQDRQVELLSHLGKLAEVMSELLLALVELTTTVVVDAEVGHDAVDDEEAVLSSSKGLGEIAELVMLVFAILCADVEDVLVRRCWVDCTA